MVLSTLKHVLVGLGQGIGMIFARRQDFTARTVFPASATFKR